MKTHFAVATAALALLGVLTLSLTGRAKIEDRDEPVRPVRVLKIAPVADKEVSVYSGEIRARFETPMAFRVPGRIAQRHVDVGASVRKGQLLATLDAADYRLSEQGLRAQVASAEADFAFQTSELARGAELLKKGFISRTDYDRRHNVYLGAKAKLEQAHASFSQTQNQAEYTELRALSDGVVTSVDAETGQVVVAGQTVLRVARLEQKEAVINIPENRLEEARTAEAIRVTLWADPGKEYRGHLREISPGVDPVTRTYTGKVALIDADEIVQIGMTATVTFDRQATERVRQVPLSALVARDGKTFVWIVDPATNTVNLVAVQIGDYRGNAVVILAGLKDSDYIVTAGVHKLFAHQKVAMLQE